jgi:hypothetical protein
MGNRDGATAKAAPEEAAPRRTFVALPLAQLLPAITRPAFRVRSPAGAALMTNWAEIVGPRLAEMTAPRKLSRGQLTIACPGPVAMELQHAAATLIERINVHAGARVVERLRFVQEPVGTPQVTASPDPPCPEPVAALPPGPLNDALARLAARLRSR